MFLQLVMSEVISVVVLKVISNCVVQDRCILCMYVCNCLAAQLFMGYGQDVIIG